MNAIIRTRDFAAPKISALDPLVAEASWVAWQVKAADPDRFSEGLQLANASAFDYLSEVAWRPGRASLITEVEYSLVDGRGVISIRLALGAFGPAGETVGELQGLVGLTEGMLGAHGARQVTVVEPGLVVPWVDGTSHPGFFGAHCVHVNQRMWTLGDAHTLIEVPSRFRPTREPWAAVIKLLDHVGLPLRVRATMLATTLSPSDRSSLRESLDAVRTLRERNLESMDVVRDADRAQATLLDIHSSFATPLFATEIAVTSSDHVPETLLRAISGYFTSEIDVMRQPGQVNVASSQVVLGGTTFDREPHDWEVAHLVGLPLHGGFSERGLEHLASLYESPVGLPLAVGGPLGSLSTHVPSIRPVPEELRPSTTRPGVVVGTTAGGEAVAVPLDLRTRHTLVTGTWGAGKSTYLKVLALDDLRAGRSFVFVDPHGTAASELIGHARCLGRDPVVIDALDGATARISLLPRLTNSPRRRLECQVAIRRVTEGIVSSLLDQEWAGPIFMMAFNAALEVVAAHGAELADGIRWLGNPEELRGRLGHPLVSSEARSVLLNLVSSSDRAQELRLWVSSKGHSLVHGMARRILAPAGSGTDVARAVFSGQPVIVSLAGLSTTEAAMVGHLIVESVMDAGFTRPVPDREEIISLYVDEAHRFPPRGLARVVAESRKFGLALVASTQACSQLSRELADLVLGSGTTVAFRSTPDTAARLAAQMGVAAEELIRLPDLHCMFASQGMPATELLVSPIEAPLVAYEPSPPKPLRAQRRKSPKAATVRPLPSRPDPKDRWIDALFEPKEDEYTVVDQL